MIEEMGLVKKVEGNTVWVETQIKTTCSSCHVKSNCGTSTIAKFFNPKPELLKLHSPISLKENQQVKLGIPEETLVSASALVYMLPLAIFIFTVAVLQSFFAMHELLALVVGIITTLLTYWWVSRFIKKQHVSSFAPVIMGAVNQASDVMKHEIPSKKLV